MFADEIAYRAVMNNFGIDALTNTDEMIRNSAGISASEYMQMTGIADITANNPALESIQSELEKMHAMQTSLEQAMNSPILEAIRNEDRIFAGVTGGLSDIGPKIISGLEEMNRRASLSGCAGFPIKSLAEESIAASTINGLGNGVIGSSLEDGFKGTCLGLAITSLEDNARQFGFAQSMSHVRVSSFGESPLSDAVKGYMGSSFGDCFEKTYLWPSLEESSQKWADCMPKMMEVRHIPEPMLITPAIIKSELHDLPFIAPISREVTLSDETIEKIAEKIAEMRSNVTIIAKNKGVAIMGDVSNNEIDTGDIIPDSDRRSE
jgi:hypothetical protein